MFLVHNPFILNDVLVQPSPLKIWIMGWNRKCIVLSLLYMQRLHTESKPQKSGPLILSQTSNVATLMHTTLGGSLDLPGFIVEHKMPTKNS